MRTVVIDTLVPGADADAVFARVADFESYLHHAPAVQEVTVTHRPDGTLVSDWAVTFRRGVLRWTELDRIDPTTRRIHFDQLDGDFDIFTGEWWVDPVGEDVAVRFVGRFDLGMPSLASIIDPIAERAMVDTMHSILRGLLGDGILFVAEPTGDPAPTASTAVRG